MTGIKGNYDASIDLSLAELIVRLRSSPFIPANVLSERLAVADGKQYSFFFETDFAGRVKAGPQIETWQRRSVAGLHTSRDSLYRTARGR
jgi:hypothetical protein